MPFVLLLVGILGVGMLGLLVLNTNLQGQTFQLRALNEQAQELANQRNQLQVQVDQLRTPAYLIGRAAKLGMVPNPSPAFVILPDGRIVGSPQAAAAGQLPEWMLKSAAQIQHDQETAAAEKKAADAARLAARTVTQQAAQDAADRAAAAKKDATDKASSTSTGPGGR